MTTKEKEKKIRLGVYAIAIIVSAIIIVIACAAACRGNLSEPTASQLHIPQDYTQPGRLLEKIPDLRGYSLEAMTREFSNLGFSPSVVMLISDAPTDTVLSIKRVGQLVPVPATIEVFVSGGFPDWDIEIPSESGSMTQQHYERIEFGGIEWLVLDEVEDKVLLLSRFVLFDMQYNNEFISSTWEISTLRNYLNNEFLNSFSSEERERIAETRNTNDGIVFTEFFSLDTWPVPGGNDTYDRIFMLSHDEQRRYFANDSSRLARMAEDHPWHSSGYNHWWWWLRSPGMCTFSAGIITVYGSDITTAFVNMQIGVRPVLWLYL